MKLAVLYIDCSCQNGCVIVIICWGFIVPQKIMKMTENEAGFERLEARGFAVDRSNSKINLRT